MGKARKIVRVLAVICVLAVLSLIVYHGLRFLRENQILRQIIARLEADSRIAEVLVTDVYFDETSGKAMTQIKFLEYAVDGKPLEPRYFTFSGNIIQFESLVVRFDDLYIRKGHPLKGRSVYLFWKVFALDGPHTEEFTITEAYQIPSGYKIVSGGRFERKIWEKFWDYALHPEAAKKVGIKNAQIEAPGTMFCPGNLYTINIEHDGGMRIDITPLSPILRGEYIS